MDKERDNWRKDENISYLDISDRFLGSSWLPYIGDTGKNQTIRLNMYFPVFQCIKKVSMSSFPQLSTQNLIYFILLDNK